MNLKPGIHPPGGYNFVESDGTIHKGDSWAHLARVVAQYRALRKLPAGDPQREITEIVCQVDPKLCHQGPGQLGTGDKDAYHTRVAGWLARLVQRTRSKVQRFVDGIVARERADVCRGCPFQEVHTKGCESCSRASEALRKQIVGDRVAAGRGLLGCALLSEDTVVSVHLEQDPAKDPRLPAHCWRRPK